MLLFARFLDIGVELVVQYSSHFQNSLELQKTAHLAFLSYSFLLKMMRRFTFGNITRQPREFKDTCPGILSLTYKKFQLPAIRDITKGYFQEHTFKKKSTEQHRMDFSHLLEVHCRAGVTWFRSEI